MKSCDSTVLVPDKLDTQSLRDQPPLKSERVQKMASLKPLGDLGVERGQRVAPVGRGTSSEAIRTVQAS